MKLMDTNLFWGYINLANEYLSFGVITVLTVCFFILLINPKRVIGGVEYRMISKTMLLKFCMIALLNCFSSLNIEIPFFIGFVF